MSPLLLLLLTLPLQSVTPGDHLRDLNVGMMSRSYKLHVPPGYDAKQPTPLVMIFHGLGGDAEDITQISGMSKKSDEAGFLLIYPNGSGSRRLMGFNAGERRGPSAENRPDDVAFVRAILDDVEKIASVDSKRVFAAGISNGGMLCYRLASEMSDRIAAVASISGPIAMQLTPPGRPVPAIHFHGTEDRVVPIDGPAKGTPAMIRFESAETTIRTWCKFNDCIESPTIEELPDRVDDGTKVVRKRYPAKSGSAEVVLILIEGGGHTWPGQPPQLPFAGKSTRDVAANDLIWEFFQKHPLEYPQVVH